MNEKKVNNAHVTSADGGEWFSVLGDHYRFKTTARDSDGALAVVQVTAFSRNGPPPHVHRREDESFYVLSGSLSVLISDEAVEVGTGSFVRIAEGTLHTYSNLGDGPARNNSTELRETRSHRPRLSVLRAA